MGKRKQQPFPPVIPTRQIDPALPGADSGLPRNAPENDTPEADPANAYCTPNPTLNLQFKSMEADP